MQRYKGLGEMNPEQLWETTLNRDVRTLLQVKLGDLDEADEIFSTPDGRHRRAAPRVHPGERAGSERGYLNPANDLTGSSRFSAHGLAGGWQVGHASALK